MRLAIYLGEDHMEAVLGTEGRRPRVKSCRTFPLPEGTLINDVVAGEEAFHEAVREIRRAYRFRCGRVRLVLGSSRTLFKTVRVPRLSGRVLAETARRELKGYQTGPETELVYDYADLGDGTILCAAVERETVRRYVERFAACGIRITCVGVAFYSIAAAAGRLMDLKKGSCLLCVLDGRNLALSLYVDGESGYTGRQRLVGVRGSREASGEILSRIRAVLQFQESRGGEPVTRLFFSGLHPEEKERLTGEARSGLGVEVQELSPDFGGKGAFPGGYLYPAGSFWSVPFGKRLNLLEAAKKKGSGSRSGLRTAVGAAAMAAVLCLSARTAWLYREAGRLRKEAGRMEAYVRDPARQEAVALARSEEKELERIRAWTLRIQEEAAELEGAPGITGDLLRAVNEAAGEEIEISGLRYEDGILSFTASMEDVREAAGLAARLKETGSFTRAGYRSLKREERYQVSMECRLKRP